MNNYPDSFDSPTSDVNCTVERVHLIGLSRRTNDGGEKIYRQRQC